MHPLMLHQSPLRHKSHSAVCAHEWLFPGVAALMSCQTRS
jgi:hypothetical protein